MKGELLVGEGIKVGIAGEYGECLVAIYCTGTGSRGAGVLRAKVSVGTLAKIYSSVMSR